MTMSPQGFLAPSAAAPHGIADALVSSTHRIMLVGLAQRLLLPWPLLGRASPAAAAEWPGAAELLLEIEACEERGD